MEDPAILMPEKRCNKRIGERKMTDLDDLKSIFSYAALFSDATIISFLHIVTIRFPGNVRLSIYFHLDNKTNNF